MGFHPVGETDSEHAFCVLLDQLTALWRGTEGPPPVADRLAVVAEVTAELRSLGTANVLYSDGDVLFAHAHRRRWDEGNGRFSSPRAPGLSTASHETLLTRGLGATAVEPGTDTLFLASVPLTDSGWTPLPEGAVLGIGDGTELARALP